MVGVCSLDPWDAGMSSPSDQPRESHSRTPDLLLTKESILRVPSGARRRSEPSQLSRYRRKISRMTTDRATAVMLIRQYPHSVVAASAGSPRIGWHTQCTLKPSTFSPSPAPYCPSDHMWPQPLSSHAPCIHRCPDSISHTGYRQFEADTMWIGGRSWRVLRNGTRLGRLEHRRRA